ncbi:MAG: flavin reductase family protein [Acidobacteriota bacterium]|nr:flavin reductase family protein [Acidobacteriota bacterium]
MEILPESLAVRDRYKLLIGTIVPRPIAVVATVSPDGRPNLAPFSFFCGVGSNPMTLAFCPGNKPDGSDKDSLRNCLPPAEGGTGEFVVNVATEGWRLQMAAAAESLPYGESEFDLAGLTPLPSRLVAPPRVAESPVAYECRTLQVIRTNPGAPAAGNLVLGEIVCAHVADGLVDEAWHVDQDVLQAIGRMGGPEYCRTRDRFAMPRGRAALQRDSAEGA